MVLTVANILVTLLAIYAALGLVFGLLFVFRGVNVVDPVAAEGTWGFRLIIIPGVVALWPLMALRWIKRQAPPRECTAHKVAACRGEK